jgi:hypothetical protein
MTKEQAEQILRGSSASVDFETGKVFDHVVLDGWFDVTEIEAVLTLLRTQIQPADGASRADYA